MWRSAFVELRPPSYCYGAIPQWRDRQVWAHAGRRCEPDGQSGDNSVMVVIMMAAVMVVTAMVVMIPMTPVIPTSATARNKNTPGGGQQRDSAYQQKHDSHG